METKLIEQGTAAAKYIVNYALDDLERNHDQHLLTVTVKLADGKECAAAVTITEHYGKIILRTHDFANRSYETKSRTLRKRNRSPGTAWQYARQQLAH